MDFDAAIGHRREPFENHRVGDDAVVAGQREILFHQIECRDQRGFLVDHKSISHV